MSWLDHFWPRPKPEPTPPPPPLVSFHVVDAQGVGVQNAEVTFRLDEDYGHGTTTVEHTVDTGRVTYEAFTTGVGVTVIVVADGFNQKEERRLIPTVSTDGPLPEWSDKLLLEYAYHPPPEDDWKPTRAQVLAIQCDLMIWCPEVKPHPDANGWDAELQIQLNGDIGRAHGIEAGWVWCTTIGNYPAEKRQFIYSRCKELGHTHFALHVAQIGPGPGYHGVFPISQAMADAYGASMNTVCAELMAHRLIPVCAGVGPDNGPAPEFNVAQVTCAMTDWDNSAAAATRVRAISDAFPNASLFFELAASNIYPEPSPDDPVSPTSSNSHDWILGMQQKYPRFSGVVHEADIGMSINDVIALYKKKHDWWHDMLENQGEVDTFDKFWNNMDYGTARLRNDDIAAGCPWQKGTMSGWTMRAAPPDEEDPTHVDAAGDMIPASEITVDGGPSDLLQWPVTSKITRLELRLTGIHVEFTKNTGPNPRPSDHPPYAGDGAWPNMKFGVNDADHLQYSMGLALYINGRWFAAAPIQCWWDRPEAGGAIQDQKIQARADLPPGQVPQNWFYDNRWPNMQRYQPKPGEKVGFFVAAGDIRGHGYTVQERSNIVAFDLPAHGTEQSFTY